MANSTTTRTPLRPTLTRAALGLALAGVGFSVACYAGVEGENPEALEERHGTVPGRWKLTPDISAISKHIYLDIDGSPLGAHKSSNCTGTFLPGSQVLKDYLLDNFDGIDFIGGYNCRAINHDPSKPTSIHGMGRALDIHVTCSGCAADNETGDEIAHWLIAHAEEIGLQRIIWDQSHWKAVGLDETYVYGGGHPHNDHLHIELNLDGGYGTTPWFQDGGADLPPVPGPQEPPSQDGCDNPCWPEYELGTYCGDGGQLLECGDFDNDGCTELVEVEACSDAALSCQGGGGQAQCCTGTFCDDDDSQFESAIEYIAGKGITNGCGDGEGGEPRYCPKEAATRAQVITMLGRASGMPQMDNDAFSDDDGHWAEGFINAAAYYGITQGIGDGKFGPQLDATRTHVAAFIVKVYDLPAAGADHFSDDDHQADWKQDVHNRLYEAGITNGCGTGKFCGDDTISREQLAAFLARCDKNLSQPSW